jgi:hypothetical protein
MFDTIHVKTPLLCPGCGAEQRSLQTKEFDSTMAHYKVGSVLSGSAVLTGIVKERLWCSECHKAGREGDSPLYLVIWHSLLAGVEQDLAKAEARLAAVDRLDLIGWIDEAQREAARWRGNYWHLYNDLHRWHDYLGRKDEPEPAGENAERQRAFRRFFDPPEEILNAPDPLAAILAANEHKDEASDD